MKKDALNMIIIIALLTCTLYFGYEKYFVKHDTNCNCDSNSSEAIDNTTSEKILDKYVGKYVSSEYDESKLDELDLYYILEVNDDGTAHYKKVFKSGSGIDATGKIAVSDNKLYLFNDKCDATEVVDKECQYANCEKIIEFDYDNSGIIKTNNGIELSKK